MPWSWLPFFRSESRTPVQPSPRPSGRRSLNRSGPKNNFRPTVVALEDRTVPSGFGGFGEFGGFGGFFGHFSPPGPATHLEVIVPESVQAGQTFNVVVEAVDASNNLATGFTDAVSLASSDTTATGLPLTYTFLASDHGIHVFQVSLTKLGSDSITASDAATGSTVTVGMASTTVNPAPTLAQLIVVTPETAAVGVATRVTVVAVDGSGHLLRNYTGTVTLGTSDLLATGLPLTYTFLASDHGIHTFQVTFETADPTTVTAMDGTVSGKASLTVDPATQVTHFEIRAQGPAVSGSATPVVIKALNASNQVVTGYTGTITLSSSDTTATAATTSGGTGTLLSASPPSPPFSFPFTAADAGVATLYVTFDMTGKQSLTVTDSTAGVTSTTNVQVVSQLHHHGWWWF